MGFVAALDEPFNLAASASTTDVPFVFPISIDGRTYEVDTSFEALKRDAFRHRSIPAQRQPTDITNVPGEATINTQGLWRRTAEDWSGGGGQLFFDRHNCDAARFRISKGVDPWTQFYLRLLPDTTQLLAINDTTIQVMCVGIYTYVLQSTQIRFSSNLITWTTCTGLPSTGLNSMCTDGYNVWVGCGSNGIYAGTSGAAGFSQMTTGNVGLVAYVGARILCANGPNVYNVISTSLSALPSPLFTHTNSQWTWTSFTSGSGQIYMAGFAGNDSEVWRTAVETGGFSAGVALTAPVLSAPMPRGELVYSMFAYLNFVLLGTSAGARFCQTLNANDPSGNAGDLRLGSIVPNLTQPMTAPCKAFTGQNQFVWFGWTNYDSGSTGLGRIDMTRFTSPQTPAYASDLMATTQGAVISADWLGSGATFNGQMTPTDGPIFAVSGVGVFQVSNTYVAEGILDQGLTTFGIPDNKTGVYYYVKPQLPLQGTIGAALSVDQGAFQSLGTVATAPPMPQFTIPQLQGEYLEPQVQLFPSTNIVYDSSTLYDTAAAYDGTNATPTVLRSTLKAMPNVVAGILISVVLSVFETVTVEGIEHFFDPYVEYAYMTNLYQTQKIVVYQEGPFSAEVIVDSLDWLPWKKRDDEDGGFQGLLTVFLRTLSG